MGTIEKSGVVKFANKKVAENGVYAADVTVNDLASKRKTFFPQQWSREKVVSKIVQAYDYFKKHGEKLPVTMPNGDFKIQGLTNDNITIEMIITRSREIKTAYPIMAKKIICNANNQKMVN